jgi:putative dehydrogenase
VKPTIAIISMGAMGAGVARSLVEGGAHVITTLEGRTQASAARAAKAGVEVLQDEAALVAQADYFLSILPPSCAVALAESLLPHIRKAQRKPVFVECNAVAPQTVLQIAAPFLAEGLPFVDAGIVGSPPVPGSAGPRFYASGPNAKQFEELRAFGLDVRPLSNEVGDASALKLSYAGFNKGVQALCSAMILGATRAGVSRALWLELQYSQPELLKLLTGALPKMYVKAYRWDGEMEEIAKFLQPDVGGSAIYMGAARLYADIASDFAAGGHERVEPLNKFIEQKS